MKRFLTFIIALLIVTKTLPFSIKIPAKLIESNATLLLRLQDKNGCDFLGQCTLTQGLVVCEDGLKTVTDEAANAMVVDRNLLSSTNDSIDEQLVVVFFQLNPGTKVVEVLVVKDCLLDEDPFGYFSLPVDDSNNSEFTANPELDQFDSVIENNQGGPSDAFSLSEYVAYAKLLVMVSTTRAMHTISAWWN